MKYKLINPIQSSYSAIEQVLVNRNIKNNEIFHYLNTTEQDINDPILLGDDNLKNAVSLLITTIKNNKDVSILVDCDCDGLCSAAILINYLYELFPQWVANHLTYILHTGKQHGLTDDYCFQELMKSDLIICPDSASNDYEQHKEIIENNKNIIILDHHEAPRISEYGVTINNQLCNYPNKFLSGGGIVYQFCRYLDNLLNQSLADKFLDLTAIALVGDMMDMREMETKHLTQLGLSAIRNPLIFNLAKKNSFKLGDHLSPIKAAFYIVPFLNSVMRSGTMEEKILVFESMLSFKAFDQIPSTKRGEKGKLEQRVTQAVRVMDAVKRRQTKAEDEAMEKLDKKIQTENLLEHKVIILLLDNSYAIPAEIRGLVANKFANKYQRPCLVLTKVQNIDNSIMPWEEPQNDMGYSYQGSARGYNKSGINNFKDICEASNFTMYCTGHQNAFGIGVDIQYIERLQRYLDFVLADTSSEIIYPVDFIFENTNVSSEIIEDISRWETLWGQEIDEPLVAIQNLCIKSDMFTLMGKNTLKITLPNKVGIIYFNAPQDFTEQLEKFENAIVNIVGYCRINTWNGIDFPQIEVKDIEIVGCKKYDF